MTFARTYDTETSQHGMLRHVLPLFGYPSLIWRNRYMVYNFYRRELMGRFHGSFLGAWWMLVQPLFLFAVYFFVFGVLFGRFEFGGERGPSDPWFAFYLFSGVILFHALTEAIGSCLNAVTRNGSLVQKVAFPSETLVLPPAMISIVLWTIGGCVCFGLGWAMGAIQPGWMLLTLPLVLIAQFVFTVGFGLFLANANVFIRDVSSLWRIVSMAWFFVTPIFWTPDLLQGLARYGLQWMEPLIRYGNPAFSLVMCHRLAIGIREPIPPPEVVAPPSQLGDFWLQLGVISAWAVFFLVLGYSMFTSKKHKFADLV